MVDLDLKTLSKKEFNNNKKKLLKLWEAQRNNIYKGGGKYGSK